MSEDKDNGEIASHEALIQLYKMRPQYMKIHLRHIATSAEEWLNNQELYGEWPNSGGKTYIIVGKYYIWNFIRISSVMMCMMEIPSQNKSLKNTDNFHHVVILLSKERSERWGFQGMLFRKRVSLTCGFHLTNLCFQEI